MKLDKILKAIFGFLLVIIFLNSLVRSFDHDELETIHTSWKIIQGERIYLDFFQHHHPLFYLFLIPLIYLFGEGVFTIITCRILAFLFLLGIFYLVFLFSKRLFRKESAVFSLIFLSSVPLFVGKAMEIRPDVPQTLAGLLAIYFLFSFLEKRSFRDLILSSFFLGFSFLFLQKTLFLVLFLAPLFLFNLYKKRINLWQFSIYICVFFLTLSPFFLYLILTRSIKSYFVFNWLINMKTLNRFFPFFTLGDTFKANNFFWILYVVGLLFFLKSSIQRQVGFLSLGLLLSVFLVKAPYDQYYMMAIPLISVVSANAFYCLFAKKKEIIAVVLILAIIIPSYKLMKRVININSRQSNKFFEKIAFGNREQLEKIEYVLSVTEKDDFVYDGDVLFNLFRKDIDFFWFSVRPGSGLLSAYQEISDYPYDIYELIDEFKPKVISSSFIENPSDGRIANYYKRSPEYENLFIRE